MRREDGDLRDGMNLVWIAMKNYFFIPVILFVIPFVVVVDLVAVFVLNVVFL
jgi:hypothetical protein